MQGSEKPNAKEPEVSEWKVKSRSLLESHIWGEYVQFLKLGKGIKACVKEKNNKSPKYLSCILIEVRGEIGNHH